MSLMGGILMIFGGFLMFAGTMRAGFSPGYLMCLHFLGIADTLGGVLVLFGLMLRHVDKVPLLTVGLGALVAWGPVLAYLMASGGESEQGRRGRNRV